MAERFGRYELLRCVGRGGMAEVFHARMLGDEGFAREVVLKRILPGFDDDPDFVRLFVAEAKLAARLHHPNIVQVFDFGRCEDRYFLVMELIPGRNLYDLLRSFEAEGRRMPVELAAHVAHEICQGLAHAHAHLDEEGHPLPIVHRDVTPSNIMVSTAGAVKLVDFGIAKAAIANAEVTRTLRGKISYLSPEQVQGDPVDQRSDVFSTGIVLYEMLTGARLFGGLSEPDRLRAVAAAEVPPLAEKRPGLPEALEAVVRRALAKERQERFQSALELAEALRPFSGNGLADREALAREVARHAAVLRPTGEHPALAETPRVVVTMGPPLDSRGLAAPTATLGNPAEGTYHIVGKRRRRVGAALGAGIGVALIAVVALLWRWPGPPPPSAACDGPGCARTLVGGSAGYKDGAGAAARLDAPYGLAFGPTGVIYVGDSRNHRIRRLDGGRLGTLAGDGTRGLVECTEGPCRPEAVRLSFPTGVVAAPVESAPGQVLLLVADSDNAAIRWLLVREPCAEAACVVRSGTLAGTRRAGFADGDPPQARFDNPKGLALSPQDVLYVADHNNHLLRRIELDRSAADAPRAVRVGTAAGDGTPGFRDGPAAHARMRGPRAVQWLGDAVYFVDGDNHLVRALRAGQVETVAGRCSPDADACPRGHRDGAPADALFDGPRGLAVDASGDLYVAEIGNHAVRLVSPSRALVRTVAGGGPGQAGLADGPGAQARLFSPHGLALTPSRDLLVADLGNHAVRSLARVTEIAF